MTTETLDWPNGPTSTDLVDGDATYNMGIKFHVVESVTCRGVSWHPPPDGVTTPPAGSHIVSLWAVVGETRLASKSFFPTTSVDQDILFDPGDEFMLLPFPVEYVVAAYTNHYVFSAPTPSSGWAVESPSGNVVATESKLIQDTNPVTYPASNFNGWYYVGPIVDTPDESEVHTTAGTAIVVPTATATRSTVRTLAGTASATATATAARATVRTLASTATTAVTATAVVSRDERTTAGAAAVSVAASATRASVRITAGTASVAVRAYRFTASRGPWPPLTTETTPGGRILTSTRFAV